MKEEQRTAMQRVLSYRAFRLMKKEGLPKQIAEERVIEDLRGDYDRNWVALDAKKDQKPKKGIILSSPTKESI